MHSLTKLEDGSYTWFCCVSILEIKIYLYSLNYVVTRKFSIPEYCVLFMMYDL